MPNGVMIVGLLPNPEGRDAGNEQVIIANSTGQSIDFSGWKLVDRAGNTYRLSGLAKPGGLLAVTMTEPTMPLNNDADTVVLVDRDGVGRSRVSYSESQVRAGATVRFGR